MILKKTALATVIALSLAACGSSGGGGGSNNNADKALSEKVEKNYQLAQKASKEAVEAKTAAEKAQADKAAAEKAMQEAVAAKNAAEQTLKNVNAAKETLAQAQADKLAAEKAMQEAVAAKNAAEQTLKSVNAAKETLAQAQADKLAAEKAMQEAVAAKNAAEQTLKNVNAAKETFAQAQADKLAAEKAMQEAVAAKNAAEAAVANADSLVKKALQDEAKRREKSRELAELALKAGLYGTAVDNFVDANLDKSEGEAKAALKVLVDEQAKRQEKINAVRKQAQEAGLNDSYAFADENFEKTEAEIKAALDTLLAKQTEEQNKRQALIDMAEIAGLDAYTAQQFATDNMAQDTATAQKALEQLVKDYDAKDVARQEKREQLTDLAIKAGLDQYRARDFANNNENKSLEEAKANLSKLTQLIDLAKGANFDDSAAQNFAFENQAKSLEVAKAKLNQQVARRDAENAKREELRNLATNAGLEGYELSDFVSNYSNSTLNAAKRELAKIQARKEEEKRIQAAREAKREKLFKLATEAGLLASQADNFARNNQDIEDTEIATALDKEFVKVANQLKFSGYDESKYPEGFSAKAELNERPVYDNTGTDTGHKNVDYKDIYNQKYSIVTGSYNKYYYYESYDNSWRSPDSYYLSEPTAMNGNAGLKTKAEKVPNEGSATYQGKAFNIKGQGDFTYNVDFSKREGSGVIKGLPELNTLTLEKGEIANRYDQSNQNSQAIISSTVSGTNARGNYGLAFFGPSAEEVAGKVTLERTFSYGSPTSMSATEGGEIGFGGTRGEIK